MSLAAEGPNAQQIEYWNDTPGQKWVTYQALLDSQIRPLGMLAMDKAALRQGERILDIGCGCGDTTIELARRVGTAGSVTGVDISAVMLAQAERNARAAGASNARFVNADAQTHTFVAASVDAVYSRFGVMFFSDPPAAFANLHNALRPEGRLTFVCWRDVRENPWMMLPLMAAVQHIQLPPPPPEGSPGPFAFADQERVRGILTQAGFTAIDFVAVDQTMTVGGSAGLDQAIDFLLEIGPAARAMREAGAEDKRPAVAAAIREVLTPFHTPQGVRMDGGVWIVSAKKS